VRPPYFGVEGFRADFRAWKQLPGRGSQLDLLEGRIEGKVVGVSCPREEHCSRLQPIRRPKVQWVEDRPGVPRSGLTVLGSIAFGGRMIRGRRWSPEVQVVELEFDRRDPEPCSGGVARLAAYELFAPESAVTLRQSERRWQEQVCFAPVDSRQMVRRWLELSMESELDYRAVASGQRPGQEMERRRRQKQQPDKATDQLATTAQAPAGSKSLTDSEESSHPD